MTKNGKHSKKARKKKKRIQKGGFTERAIKKSQERLLQKVKEQPIHPRMQLSTEPPPEGKMSEVIIDFAKPILKEDEDVEIQKKTIILAIIIWNLSLLPEELQEEQAIEIRSLLGNSNEADRLINYLLARKEDFFKDIKRMVVDYDFVSLPRGFHLNVLSTVMTRDTN